MKTIAKSFVAVCLVAAGGAFAADTPAPASANETTALIESFPNMVTYEQLHRRDASSAVAKDQDGDKSASPKG